MLALLLERDPNLTPDQARDVLLEACDPLGGFDGAAQGQGMVSLTRVT